jgi:transcriptional regulator with XRE-family HTH domain
MEATPVIDPSWSDRSGSFRYEIGAELGRQIRWARMRRGLGLREAARRLGTTHGYLGLLEQGVRAPRGDLAECIIALVHLDASWARQLREFAEMVDAGRDRRAMERNGGLVIVRDQP